MKFERFEFKFSEEHVKLIDFINRIDFSMKKDLYCANGPYTVDSIYFDCKSLKDFHDKQNALLVRGKFRLRAYGNIFHAKKVFLEYKGKQGDFVIKERIEISSEKVKMILNGSPISTILGRDIKGFSYSVMRELLMRPTLRPLTVVSYNRAAFIFKIDERVRLTIDSDIRSKKYVGLYDRKDLYSMRGGKSIMELKFEKDLPKIINETIKQLNMTRVSNSKAEFSFEENAIHWI